MTNPQTWNRYAYVGNNPLSHVDPLGLYYCGPDEGLWCFNPLWGGGSYITDICDGYLGYFFNRSCRDIPDKPDPHKGGNNTTKKKCPTVPQHPPGADINSNIRNAKPAQFLTMTSPAISLGLFYLMVRGHSPMDYKQQGATLTDTGGLGPSPFQDFGNFNYGAVGTAWGIDQNTLLRGAGYAQEKSGTSTPGWGHWYNGTPYGDDPDDQEEIMQGIQYYQNGCYKSANPG